MIWLNVAWHEYLHLSKQVIAAGMKEPGRNGGLESVVLLDADIDENSQKYVYGAKQKDTSDHIVTMAYSTN